jgi:hypothetical protein
MRRRKLFVVLAGLGAWQAGTPLGKIDPPPGLLAPRWKLLLPLQQRRTGGMRWHAHPAESCGIGVMKASTTGGTGTRPT